VDGGLEDGTTATRRASLTMISTVVAQVFFIKSAALTFRQACV